MNKKQLSDIIEVILDPMQGKEFYNRERLKAVLDKINIITLDMHIYNGTPQEKIVRIVNNYVKRNVVFRRNYLDKFYGTKDKFDKKELIYRTAYAALIKNEAVCSGYTEAVRVLLAYYGIKSKTIITKIPRRLHEASCHYLTAVFLDDGSIKLLDPERQQYCEKKGYDFQEYLEKLEFAIPNEICWKNKLINDGTGMFASEYLNQQGVKKAKGIIEMKKLLKKEFNTDLEFSKESFELNFLGKSYAKMITGLDTETVIEPDLGHNNKEENINSENIYISGDNIDALKHLVKAYEGKIKCIYIDTI